jgi:hypothetical protein
MITMNLRDNQQDVTSAQDDVDLVSKGLIDIKSIPCDIDLYLKELSEEWKASIPFTCYVMNENDQPCSFAIGSTLSRIDICDYLGGQMYPAARLAFCPNTYKPPSSNDEMNSKHAESCNGWTDLHQDFSIAAHDAGNPIISNGSQQSIGREANNLVFRCETFYLSSKTSTMELSDIAQYRCMSLVNDWKNNHVKGRELPKRIKTVDQRGCACLF